ncbi:MAG: hypothetical protein NT025_08660 [bacterium]|nr:hypothetical protein [bacterium]
MSLEDRLVELVGEAAEVFGWEEIGEETDVEISESEDFPYPFTDIVHDGAVFRLFVTDRAANLDNDLADFFDHYRDFESEYEDVEQATLVWRAANDEDDFWYLRRTEEGDIGLFHSDLSLEEEDEEEGNGKKL